MTILFYCNTYMQLITAINLKVTKYRDSEVDVMLSNHSNKSDSVIGRIKRIGIFRKAYYLRTKEFVYKRGLIDRTKDIWDINHGNSKRIFSVLGFEPNAYDLIFFYNNDLVLYYIFDTSVRKGVIPQVIQMEESISSYASFGSVYGSAMKLTKLERELTNKPDPKIVCNTFACYHPEILSLKSNQRCYQIPLLERENKELINILNETFDYHLDGEWYGSKYIYFASASDIDGYPVGETELVMKIAKLVGPENLLVKMHPRDLRTVYSDAGISVDRNSSIPWEIMQINNLFENKIFLSMSSGSVLNATAMLNDDIKTWYLYKVLNKHSKLLDSIMNDEIRPTLSKLHKKGQCLCIQEVNDLRDILS